MKYYNCPSDFLYATLYEGGYFEKEHYDKTWIYSLFGNTVFACYQLPCSVPVCS